MNAPLSEIEKRYASLSDDELLYIATTSPLTEDADKAIDAELKKRDLEAELGSYYEELVEKSHRIERYDKKRLRIYQIISVLLFFILPAIVWWVKHW